MEEKTHNIKHLPVDSPDMSAYFAGTIECFQSNGFVLEMWVANDDRRKDISIVALLSDPHWLLGFEPVRPFCWASQISDTANFEGVLLLCSDSLH